MRFRRIGSNRPPLFSRAFTCAALLFAAAGSGSGQEAHITVHADDVSHHLSRYLTGACIEDVNHEIYGGLYSQMVFGESFQEPAPPGKIVGFAAFGGDWSAANGEVQVSGGDGPKLIVDSSEQTVGEASVEVYLPGQAAGPAGFIVKVKDSAVGADRFTGYEVTLDANRHGLLLGRHRQNWEPIRFVSCDVTPDRWIALSVRTTETTLEASVDGKPVLQYTDTEHPLRSGSIGLRTWQRPARFRNLRVESGSAPRDIPFVEGAGAAHVSGMWRAVEHGSAVGSFALETAHPFVGAQCQRITFVSGQGVVGIDNRGLNRWGMAFVGGMAYEGVVWLRAEKSTDVTLALQSREGPRRYGTTQVHVRPGDWQRLPFTLTPIGSDPDGRLTLFLTSPGSVDVGYVGLQPGAWGRFKGLPVRRDVAEGMRAEGLTVVRYGGSMVNAPAYRWKPMLGPRERRQPYKGLWYPYSSNGWGIPEFLDFAEALGVLGIPAFNMDETPQDMADFVAYANGPTGSAWGRKRAEAGHPRPYGLRAIELGNEESVDAHYWERFEPMARAIWKVDPKIILVVGDFAYDKRIDDPFRFTGAPNINTLAVHQKILNLAREQNRTVWFDVHVWNQEADQPRNIDGVSSYAEWLAKLSPGADFKVAVFELNANKHGVQRGLGTAHALNELERMGDRLAVVCSANGLQPDGQNDNGWDQGLLFLSPSRVWAQPPYYVTQMFARNYLPLCVRAEVDAPPNTLDVTATRSANGKILQLQVLNYGAAAISAQISLEGFQSAHTTARVEAIMGAPDAVNTAEHPHQIVPIGRAWPNALSGDAARYLFPPNSFTLLRFQ